MPTMAASAEAQFFKCLLRLCQASQIETLEVERKQVDLIYLIYWVLSCLGRLGQGFLTD